MDEQFKRLKENLNAFIRKYYYNMLIRGGLYTVAITLGFFLLFDILEYFFYFGKTARLVVFVVYMLMSVSAIVVFIIIPLFRLTGILPKISEEEAARIIGSHFPEIQDKLLNTLQLYKKRNKGDENINLRLLNASIEARALKLSPFSFKRAVNFSVNKKYLKWALPPLLIVLVLLISSPSVIITPTVRLINFDSVYAPPPPFVFVLKNKTLSVEEGKDFMVKLKIDGETVPEDIVLTMNGFDYLMKKTSPVNYGYLIKNVRKPVDFYFKSGEYRSRDYRIELLHTPKIVKAGVKIKYPAYLKKDEEFIENLVDLSIPEGSSLSFEFRTKDAENVLAVTDGKATDDLTKKAGGFFTYLKNNLKSSAVFGFVPVNGNVNPTDTLFYNVLVIRDEFPQIKVREFKDSVFEKQRFFRGYIKDDYGFTGLSFEVDYTTTSGNDSVIRLQLPFSPGVEGQEFLYFYDFAKLDFLKGTSIKYSFVVADNDAMNGYKKTRSRDFVIMTKTEDEEIASADKRDEELQKSVDAGVKKADELSKELQKLSDKLKGKKNLTWDDKKEIKEVLKKYEELQKEIEQKKEEKKLNDLKDSENNLMDEELKKKQDELNKLFEELMTPEMKELLEQMREMLEKNVKKEDVDKAIEQMKMDSEYLKKQLERDLEIMKQLKFDQKFQQAIDKLQKLEEKQRELAAKAKEKSADSENLKQQQDSLNAEFEKFKEMMEEARKANSELSKPNNLEDTKPQESSIEQDMQESSNNLSGGKRKKASSSQQSAAQKMKSLSEKMQQMQADMQSQSSAEDMENLKNIMENLIQISFNQEELMEKVKVTSNRDPKFPEFVEQQSRIARDLQMVEDSLMKLARRNPSISPLVNKEISRIKSYSEKTFLQLKEMNTIAPTSRRQMQGATASQQYIMTSVNNLALMLSEALDQMKRQQMSKSGKGSCNKPKPGAGGGSMKTMRQMQQALQKQMEQMKKQMEQAGKSQGKGGKSQKNGEKMSEEFAKMAAQQEAIRKKLQEYRDQMAKQGNLKQAGQLGKIANEMEKNETDLVNKILTAESLMRQKEILTRLLESEKAEREREQQEERKSKEGKNIKNSNKILEFQYKDENGGDIDLLRLMPPELRPFYKKLVDEYFGN